MEKGALDLLFFELIKISKLNKKKFFDFGISTENNGSVLNGSLAHFKEGFGGRSTVHHKLEIKI